jgi:hypothetical protein
LKHKRVTSASTYFGFKHVSLFVKIARQRCVTTNLEGPDASLLSLLTEFLGPSLIEMLRYDSLPANKTRKAALQITEAVVYLHKITN